MSALLKKIEARASRGMQDQQDAEEISLLSEMRDGINKLVSLQAEDESRDERIKLIEDLLLRMYDSISKDEEDDSEEDGKPESNDDSEEGDKDESEDECAKLEAELAECELECERVEKERDAAREELLAEVRRCGDVRAELAKYEAMCEAEKCAKMVAETALAQAKAEHEKFMQMIAPILGKLSKGLDHGAG